MRIKTNKDARQRIRYRIYKKLRGTTERPRMAVFRSNKHIYAQVINDETGTTVASASSREPKVVKGGNCDGAKEVGKLVAERVKEKGLDSVVFDRGGFRYHGRVRALADAAREAGLKF